MKSVQVYYSGYAVVLNIENMLMIDIELLKEDEIINLCKIFYEKQKINSRLYKTKNGYRLFSTNKIFDVKKDKGFLYEIYNFFHGDEGYLNMLYSYYLPRCQFDEKIKCKFHVRISPKNENFVTFDQEKIKKHFFFYQKDNSIAVARYITSIGNGLILDEFKDFIIKHDKATKAFLKDSILV